MKLSLKIFALLLYFFCSVPGVGARGAELYVVRDSEIESYIGRMLDEMLLAAGLNSKSVKFYLVKDDSINAFVYGGNNIFIHTGLIQTAKTYQELQAVLAHEIGHIAGFHLVARSEKYSSAKIEGLIYGSAALLIMAAGRAGAEGVVSGLALGSHIATRRMFKFSRADEAEADSYLVKILRNIKSSGEGAITIFERLKTVSDRFIDPTMVNEYVQSHPLTETRISYIKQKFANLQYTPFFNEELQKKHLFATAKLAGYFDNSSLMFSDDFRKNDATNTYFSVFDNLQKRRFRLAEQHIAKLISKDKTNPYFYEVAADIAAKQGNFRLAVQNIKIAHSILPKDFGILFQYAEYFFFLQDFTNAIKYMKRAFLIEPLNPQVPLKLATFYNRIGQDTEARIYFLESEVLGQNFKKAKELVKSIRASQLVLNSYQSKKVQDIEDLLKQK